MYLVIIETYGSACVTQIGHCGYSTPYPNTGAHMRKHMADQGGDSHFNSAHIRFHLNMNQKISPPACLSQGWLCHRFLVTSQFHPHLSSPVSSSSEQSLHYHLSSHSNSPGSPPYSKAGSMLLGSLLCHSLEAGGHVGDF